MQYTKQITKKMLLVDQLILNILDQTYIVEVLMLF